ncbi:Alpha-ribazole phosphatase [Clavibacter michiganensis subsp. michiganensis]|uniref:Alpha-ribazole phosphatase n=1 Tax=Clavibacter michiganensis subsp. michiganensis TaxID=33013 RepID=A0A251XL58_CLAMM|nr:Alpha-ribazole phosphatase [Clavibacter michiganensis subsp. michiganensis]OUE04130.1 Alpha-ribazole phosphatase [Clavibacter michiganensis subsp. michiganensis]
MQTPPAAPARLLLTRHAQTPWNREYRYNSRTDVDVGDDAAEQLAPLAARLRGEGVERILVSTLARARSTARILQEQGVAPAVAPEPRPELVELDFGGFEGITRDELRGPVHGAAFAAWLTGEDGEPAAPGGGETWAAAAVRAQAILDDVAADPRTTLVVAHGYLLRVLYLTALGRSPALTRSLVWRTGSSSSWSATDPGGASRALLPARRPGPRDPRTPPGSGARTRPRRSRPSRPCPRRGARAGRR